MYYCGQCLITMHFSFKYGDTCFSQNKFNPVEIELKSKGSQSEEMIARHTNLIFTKQQAQILLISQNK